MENVYFYCDTFNFFFHIFLTKQKTLFSTTGKAMAINPIGRVKPSEQDGVLGIPVVGSNTWTDGYFKY